MGAPKGCNQHGHVWAHCRKALVGTGRAMFALFGINGLRKKLSYLVGPSFLVFMASFSTTPGWHFPRALIEGS